MKDELLNTNKDVLRVFIVRHGQTDWNVERILQGHKDIPMNANGHEQASKLGDYLEMQGFSWENDQMVKVISSDLTRCKETVKRFTKNKEPANISYTALLRERFMGDVQGMKIDKAKEVYGEANYRNLGESGEEMVERLMKCWDEQVLPSNCPNVVLCTHGGVIRHLSKHLVSGKGYQDLSTPGVGTVPYNTSVSIVDIDINTGEGAFLEYADRSHLATSENKSQVGVYEY